MCGRFVLFADDTAIQQMFNVDLLTSVAPRYNIAPTQPVAVITNENPRQLDHFRWGLVPSWAKDINIGSKMINARAETLPEKPAFRAAFKRRRCLIPASGFYEWQQRETGKAPMFIHLKDQPLFAFAGLWEIWQAPDGGELRSFTIVTTEANEFMETIHNRMPVILHPDEYAAWLRPEDVPAAELMPLLQPYDSSAMTAYEVSKAVNRPTVDSPELIQPLH